MRLSRSLLATLRHHNEYFLDNGLYDTAKIRFADRISPMGNRSRRKMELNLKWKALHSPTLSRNIRVRLTADDVLIRIDEAGGIDNYVLGQERMEGLKAEAIKKALIMRRWREELAEKSIPMNYKLNDYGKRV